MILQEISKSTIAEFNAKNPNSIIMFGLKFSPNSKKMKDLVGSVTTELLLGGCFCDYDSNKELAIEYHVRQIPALVFVRRTMRKTEVMKILTLPLTGTEITEAIDEVFRH